MENGCSFPLYMGCFYYTSENVCDAHRCIFERYRKWSQTCYYPFRVIIHFSWRIHTVIVVDVLQATPITPLQ